MRPPRHLAIWAAVCLQVFCATVFIWNFIATVFALRTRPVAWQIVELLEICASIGLVLGAIVGIRALIRARRETLRAEAALRSASGAFAEIVEDRIRLWSLTPAETEVAWLLIKGFGTAEIATLRGTSEGTVKAQSNAIYRKAAVSSRAQLLATLVEDLLAPDPGTPLAKPVKPV